MFTFFNKKILYKDIENYTSWKGKRYPCSASSDKQYLDHFAKVIKAKDVSEIRVDDILYFRDEVLKYSSRHISNEVTKAVKCMIRYYRARRLYVVDERIFKM